MSARVSSPRRELAEALGFILVLALAGGAVGLTVRGAAKLALVLL